MIRDRREVYLPFKECNSGRGGVKAEPEDHHHHRHFLRHGNFRTDNTYDLRIWNWLPLNNRCLHSPWEVFEVPRGVHPLGSEGRCSKSPTCTDLKFKGRWERQRNTRKQRFFKNYPKYDSTLGCFIHIFFGEWELVFKMLIYKMCFHTFDIIRCASILKQKFSLLQNEHCYPFPDRSYST